MSQSILVAYATKHGSTRDVAEAIASRLDTRGLRTNVMPARDVRELKGYDGVVLGGSIYMGRWHADARHLLKKHRRALSSLPLAVFAMGPTTMSDHDVDGTRKQLDQALAKTPEVEPVAVAIFGGVVDPRQLHFPFSHMPASDARDWDAIHAWADAVAEELDAEVAVLA